MVKAGTYSLELCGGCHVARTGQIGLFKLVQEGGIGSGIRRVEAVTGKYAYEYVLAQEKLLLSIGESLRANIGQLPQRVESMLLHAKQLERDMESLTSKLGRLEAMQLLQSIELLQDSAMLIAKVAEMDVDQLRAIVDELKGQRQDLLMILSSVKDDKVAIVVYVPTVLQAKGYHAGKLVKEIAAVVGGSGGGRADIAQAGGKNPLQIDAALATARRLLSV